VAGELPKWAGV